MHAVLRLILGDKRTAVVGLVCGAFLGIVSVALAAQATSGIVYSPTIL